MQPGTEGVGDVISGLLPLLSGFGNNPQRTFQSTVQAQQSAKKQRTEEEQRRYEARLKQAGEEIFSLPRENMGGPVLKQIADKYDVRAPDVMQMTTNVLKLESENQMQMGRVRAEQFDANNDLKAITSGQLPGSLQAISDEIAKMDSEITRIQGTLGQDAAPFSKQYQALAAKRESAGEAYNREKDRVWMRINDPSLRQSVEGILTDPDGTRRKVKLSPEEARAYGDRFKEGVPEFFGKKDTEGASGDWGGMKMNQQLDQVGKFYKDQAPYMFDDMGFIKPEYADKYPKVANLLAEERRRVVNGDRPKFLTLTEYLDPKTGMPNEMVSPHQMEKQQPQQTQQAPQADTGGAEEKIKAWLSDETKVDPAEAQKIETAFKAASQSAGGGAPSMEEVVAEYNKLNATSPTQTQPQGANPWDAWR